MIIISKEPSGIQIPETNLTTGICIRVWARQFRGLVYREEGKSHQVRLALATSRREKIPIVAESQTLNAVLMATCQQSAGLSTGRDIPKPDRAIAAVKETQG